MNLNPRIAKNRAAGKCNNCIGCVTNCDAPMWEDPCPGRHSAISVLLPIKPCVVVIGRKSCVQVKDTCDTPCFTPGNGAFYLSWRGFRLFFTCKQSPSQQGEHDVFADVSRPRAGIRVPAIDDLSHAAVKRFWEIQANCAGTVSEVKHSLWRRCVPVFRSSQLLNVIKPLRGLARLWLVVSQRWRAGLGSTGRRGFGRCGTADGGDNSAAPESFGT